MVRNMDRINSNSGFFDSNPVWDFTVGKILKQVIVQTSIRKCFACHSKYNLTSHHIVPLNQGGLDLFDNLVTLCSSCHTSLHQDSSYDRFVHSDREFIERLYQLRLFKELEPKFKKDFKDKFRGGLG